MPDGRKLVRVEQRADPASWDPHELMTLREAVQLFFPDGPLTLSGLRTAARDGDLAVRRIAGKMLTTKESVLAMGKCAREAPSDADVLPTSAMPSKPLSRTEARALLEGRGG